ncbi:MAG: DMT family protein [Betaproteobacteria bacterium]
MGPLRLSASLPVACNAPVGFADNRGHAFFQSIPLSLQTVLLRVASNVFMTLAWYGHLKSLATAPWYAAALVSWGIALFGYLLQVPANRIGYQQAGFSVGQLKVMQEVTTLCVFVPFAMLSLDEPFRADCVWAGWCLLGTVYFIFCGG